MGTLLLMLALSQEPPPNGAPVEVWLQAGDVTLQTEGRLVPCVRDRRCAQLKNGKRVQGRLQAGRFVVDEVSR